MAITTLHGPETYITPFTTSGVASTPRRERALKSALQTMPICATLSGVIWVSGLKRVSPPSNP
jgi:hypothetical protein